jgi:hypothetical protein
MSATINLVGPSTDPGAPIITPQEVNDEVNLALQTNATAAANDFASAVNLALIAQTDATSALANAAAAAATANAALPKAGGVMTGDITLAGDGAAALNPTTKQQLDAVSALVSAGLGGITVKGVWDASTNSPTLASGVGTQGDSWTSEPRALRRLTAYLCGAWLTRRYSRQAHGSGLPSRRRLAAWLFRTPTTLRSPAALLPDNPCLGCHLAASLR